MIVCGTNFGTRYLEAIRRAPDRYQLAGIVSRGSARSTLLAARYGVPLYRSAGEVPAGVDAAFAAMGSEGEPVVLELLDRGMHVLCEHPISEEFLTQALERAKTRNVTFHVDGHFAGLKAPRAFINHCAAILQRERPIFIDAAMTPRLIYGLVDILGHAGIPLWPVDLRAAEQSDRWFLTLEGMLGSIGTSLHLERLQPEMSEDNVVDCRIEIGFFSGVVRLLSLAGPVVWNSNYRRSGGPMAEMIFAPHAVTVEEFQEERLKALGNAMESLIGEAHHGAARPEQTADHLLNVRRAYEAIANLAFSEV